LDPQSVLDPRRMILAPVRFLPQLFFHMILRHQKYQRKPNNMNIIPKIKHAFLHNPEFEGYGNNTNKEFDKNQSCVVEEFH
jgi:hypothetical protein